MQTLRPLREGDFDRGEVSPRINKELYPSTPIHMSDLLGADQPQGEPSIEERISAVEQSESPQEETPSPAPTPSADEQPTEATQDDSLTEDQDDVSAEEAEALANAKNPERTREYIERLKRERDEARAGHKQQAPQNVFDQFRIPGADTAPVMDANNYDGLNQKQVDSIAQGFVDEDGNVDVQGLNQALQMANQRATQAERSAQQAVDRITKYEESRQLQEAYEPYPQLDPQNKNFDREFYTIVSEKLMIENYARGGAMTVKQAADQVAQFYRRPETNVAKLKEEAVREYKEAQAKRTQQAPVERGRGEGRESLEDYQDLRSRTRRGDYRATASRIDAATRE